MHPLAVDGVERRFAVARGKRIADHIGQVQAIARDHVDKAQIAPTHTGGQERLLGVVLAVLYAHQDRRPAQQPFENQRPAQGIDQPQVVHGPGDGVGTVAQAGVAPLLPQRIGHRNRHDLSRRPVEAPQVEQFLLGQRGALHRPGIGAAILGAARTAATPGIGVLQAQALACSGAAFVGHKCLHVQETVLPK